jgi:hypothetical protein
MVWKEHQGGIFLAEKRRGGWEVSCGDIKEIGLVEEEGMCTGTWVCMVKKSDSMAWTSDNRQWFPSLAAH